MNKNKPIFGPLTKKPIPPQAKEVQDAILSLNRKLHGDEAFNLATICDLYGHENDDQCQRNILTKKGDLYVGLCKMAIDHDAKFK